MVASLVRSREELLREMATAEQALRELASLAPAADPVARSRLALHETMYSDQLLRANADYVAGLSRRAVTRCPLSAAEIALTIDDVGLDGPWWQYDGASRPPETWPPTLFALSGAMRLQQPLDRSPFLCVPGPEVPFVVPRLIEVESIIAVVSSLPIGRHTGYVIAYFTSDAPNIAPTNTWGSNEYATRDGGWGAAEDDEERFDYELGPLIASGRVRWIAPGDTSLRVREGVADCPYMGLPGRRAVQRLQEGVLW